MTTRIDLTFDSVQQGSCETWRLIVLITWPVHFVYKISVRVDHFENINLCNAYLCV